MEVFAVILSIAYEGEWLLGIFSSYVKAREYQISLKDSDIYIRKVQLDEIYQLGQCGEEI
jgi:hypothetical protein